MTLRNGDRSVLRGTLVRLEPLATKHSEGLAAASAGDRELYRWSPTPLDADAAREYVRVAVAARDAGVAIPFAVIRQKDDVVIGSSRLFNLELWAWPEGHARYVRTDVDVCEIGYTWFGRGAIRTGANTETKRLMLAHAFESLGALAVCFHTDSRNERSRTALARIGAQFDGVLRAHRLAVDGIPRDSARFSILASEWLQVRAKLDERLAATGPGSPT